MALIIKEECINCDICVPECPNEAISMGNEIYEIDAKRCTECVGHYDSPTCIKVCPIRCISVDPNNQETLDELAIKFVALTSEPEGRALA